MDNGLIFPYPLTRAHAESEWVESKKKWRGRVMRKINKKKREQKM